MAENDSPLTSQVVADSVDQLLVPVECILNCLVHSGKSGPKDQVALHYYYTSPSHWCTTHEVSKL